VLELVHRRLAGVVEIGTNEVCFDLGAMLYV